MHRAAPFGRERRGLAGQVLLAADGCRRLLLDRAGRAGEAGVAAVEIGQRAAQGHPVGRGDFPLGLDPLRAHGGGVADHERGAAERGDLQVLVIRAEQRDAGPGAVVEELALQAQFPGLDGLVLELGARTRRAGRRRAIGREVEAARLEAPRPGQIGHGVPSQVPLQVDGRGEVLFLARQVLVMRIGREGRGHHRAQDRGLAGGQGAGRDAGRQHGQGVGVGAEQAGHQRHVLLVPRPAQAQIGAEAVGEGPGRLAEHRQCRGVLVHVGRTANGRQQDQADPGDGAGEQGRAAQHRGRQSAHRAVDLGGGVGIEVLGLVVGPDDAAQMTALLEGQPQLLAGLVEVLGLMVLHQVDRQEVDVLYEVIFEARIAGDRGQLTPAQVPGGVDRAVEDLLVVRVVGGFLQVAGEGRPLADGLAVGGAELGVGQGRRERGDPRGDRQGRAERGVEHPDDPVGAVGVTLGVAQAGHDLEGVGRGPGQAAAQELGRAGRFVGMALLVVDVAVGGFPTAGQAQAEVLADRAGQDAGRPVGVELGLGVGGEVVGEGRAGLGRGGDDIDRPGHGVLAKQRALRTAQHLDPLQVDHRLQELAAAGHVDAVDIHADRLFEAAVAAAADAADVDRGGLGAAADLHVRHRRRQLLQVGDALLGDPLAADGGHRQGRGLQGLGPLARGDHDLLQRHAGGWSLGGLPGQGRRGAGQREHGGPQHQGLLEVIENWTCGQLALPRTVL